MTDKLKQNNIVNLTKLEDSTIKLTIKVSWDEVEKVRKQVMDEKIKNLTLPGFRKGSVPKNIAEQKLDKGNIQEETLKRILPHAYVEAVKAHNITPIINPRIHIEAFVEGTDLAFTAETCEEPEIKLSNYKDEVKKLTAKSKIIVPGKDNPSTNSGQEKPNMDEIIETVLKHAEAKISKLLIEHETNRLLSQFLDEIKLLGMNLEQYLASKNIKGEDLRVEYEKKAEKDLKLEFLLRKIADDEAIQVEEKDINEVLEKIQDEKQKQEIKKNSYMLSAIIRQQKTLDFLSKI